MMKKKLENKSGAPVGEKKSSKRKTRGKRGPDTVSGHLRAGAKKNREDSRAALKTSAALVGATGALAASGVGTPLAILTGSVGAVMGMSGISMAEKAKKGDRAAKGFENSGLPSKPDAKKERAALNGTEKAKFKKATGKKAAAKKSAPKSKSAEKKSDGFVEAHRKRSGGKTIKVDRRRQTKSEMQRSR